MKGLLNCLETEQNETLTINSYLRLRKNKIYKNVILSSLSQSLVYVMYKTMMLIREYEHDFLGIWSYTSFNIAKILGFILLPASVLSLLRLQKTIRYGMLVSSLLIFFHYFKRIESVISVASLMGLIGATTWLAQLMYVNRCAKIMSKICGDDLETILLRLSGIFFSIYRLHELLCYLPVSFVLAPTSQTFYNESVADRCGKNFHFGDYDSLSHLTAPPRDKQTFAASITLFVLAFCVLLLSIWLIDSPHKLTATYLGYENYGRNGVGTIFRLFKNRNLQLIIPMSLFAGCEKMIKSYDYTTAYVGCTELSVRIIYVNFLGCLAASQMSLSLAPLVQVTSLQIMLCIAAFIHFVLILILLFKNNIDLISYYVISTMWGLASSTWDCLLYVLYGMIIPGDEFEAYCHLGLWYSVGAAANLVVTRLVSVSVKLWTALFFLLMASVSILMLPYVISCAPSKKNKVRPMKNRRSVGTSTQEENDDKSRRPSMHLGKSTSSRQYEPVQVKTISTLKIYHLAVPKTRPRYERQESSDLEIGNFI